MLCERLTDPARLGDRRYVAEPKLDGQRAQFHVEGGRAVACYSRPGLDLLRHAGMVWLREVVWPFDAAVLDGEACAGDGHKGIQAVFAERKRPGGDMSLVPMPNDRYTGRRRDADGRIGTAVLGGGARRIRGFMLSMLPERPRRSGRRATASWRPRASSAGNAATRRPPHEGRDVRDRVPS